MIKRAPVIQQEIEGNYMLRKATRLEISEYTIQESAASKKQDRSKLDIEFQRLYLKHRTKKHQTNFPENVKSENKLPELWSQSPTTDYPTE